MNLVEAQQRSKSAVSIEEGIEFLTDSQNQILWMAREAAAALLAKSGSPRPDRRLTGHRLEPEYEHDVMAGPSQKRQVGGTWSRMEDHHNADSDGYSVQYSHASSPGFSIASSLEYHADAEASDDASTGVNSKRRGEPTRSPLSKKHQSGGSEGILHQAPTTPRKGRTKRHRNDDSENVPQRAPKAARPMLADANAKVKKRLNEEEQPASQDKARKKHRPDSSSDKEN